MQAIELDYTNPDWLLIRQALSLALLGNRPVLITHGGDFLDGAPSYRPLFEDAARTLPLLGAGLLALEGKAILYEPEAIRPGRFRIESGAFSSAVELLLLLAPALLHCDVRSVLECSGVTHSPDSCPTAYVKDDLLARLERLGFYGSLALRRFGFYATGGGSMESRLYPRERAPEAADGAGGSLTGARIYIARLSTELAEQEKIMLADRLTLEPGRISIIEVMDAAGAGNSIQVFGECGGAPAVIYGEMRIFDENGGTIFSEEELGRVMDRIAADAGALVHEGTLPERAAREMVPYTVMAGRVPSQPGGSPGERMTLDLCARLL